MLVVLSLLGFGIGLIFFGFWVDNNVNIDRDGEPFQVGGALLLFAGLAFGIVAIATQVRKPFEYLDKVQERAIIVYRVENETDGSIITQNPQVYDAILQFNKDVIFAQTYHDNIWIGWFVNDKLAELDPITLGD